MKNRLNHVVTTLLILPFFANCQSTTTVKTGVWRAALETSGGQLPFGLDIKPAAAQAGKYTVFAINGAERLPMDEATLQGDTLRIPMGLFESELVAKVEGDKLTGTWRKRRVKDQFQIVPFSARFGEANRFNVPAGVAPAGDLSGKWQTVFRAAGSDGTPGDTTAAVGVFVQKGNEVTGTFLTPTGDYRYLAGNAFGDSLLLSCFDGSHAFLFKAKKGPNQTLTGVFHSGPT
ncbi:MAG: TlpA family protein disulfide reductase, partial [Cytophagaceae bacterium]